MDASILQQAEEIYRILVQQHVMNEPSLLPYAILAIPMGLLFFIILTWRYEGHLRGLWDRISFFFNPRPPEWFIEVVDVYGVWHSYSYDVIPGKNYWLIKVGGKEYKVLGDPKRFAVPVGLLDMKSSQPGVPSPFGYVSRLLIAWIISLIFAVYAWAYTAYLSITAYRINPTWIDVATTIAFVVVMVWFIIIVLRLNNASGLALWLVELPGSGIAIPAVPSPAHLAEWRNMLIESLGSHECKLNETCEKILKAVEYKAPEKAAEIIMSMAEDAINWRYRYSALEQQIEKHIEAAVSVAQRSQEPRDRLSRRFWLALLAIGAIAVAAFIIALQPSVHSLHNATTMAQPVPPLGAGTAPSPAQPPSPPGAAENVSISPAQPPSPPNASANVTVTPPVPPSPPVGG